MGTLHDADIVIGAQIDTEQAEKSAQGLTEALGEAMESGAAQAKKSYAQMQSDIMKLANEYKKQGLSMSDALKRAHSEIDKSQYETARTAKEAAKEYQDTWENSGQSFSSFISAKAVALGNLISDLVSKMASAAVEAGKQLVSAGVQYNAQLEQYGVALTTLLGDAEAAANALEAIKEDAARTPFDTASLVQANRFLLAAGENAAYSRAAINALGDAVSAVGGGSDELQRMAANLQQIANAGKATEMDIRQFAYAGIDIYGILADYTGKTTAEVQEMTVTYNDLTAALIAASEEGGRFYGAMDEQSQTLNGRISTLKDNWTQFLGSLTEGLTQSYGGLIEASIDWIETLKTALETDGVEGMFAAGSQIAYSLIQGFVENVRGLVNAGLAGIEGLANSLTANMGTIFDLGLDILYNIVEGIRDGLPDLIRSAAKLVTSFGVEILNHADEICEIGKNIVFALIEGIVYLVEDLAEAALGLVLRFLHVWDGSMDDFGQIGSNAVQSLIDGILGRKNDVQNAAKSIYDAAKRGFSGMGGGQSSGDGAGRPNYEKDQSYWEQVAEHYTATGQDQRQGNYSPALDFDFTGLGKTAGSAAKQVETLADKLAKAEKALSGSRSAYAALTDAAAEYNETGRISAATWQEIMTLAPEYQALLVKEGDTLRINEAAYADLTAAQRLEIETLAAQNGTTAETIALLDEMIAGTQKAGAAFDELRQKLEDAIQGSPLEVIGGLAEALASGDWTGAAKALAEGLWLTLPGQQQDAISSWITQAVEQINAGFAADGWAGLVNAGAAVVQGLAEGITSGESVFLDAVGGLLGGFSGIGEKVLPAVSQAALSLLNALNLLVPGIDLASGATAVFNAILDANPIILVVSLLGMLGAALYGFAQTNTEAGDAIRSTWAGVVDFLKGALRTVLGIIEAALEAVFASYNIIAGTIGKLIGLEEIHFDLTSWLDHDDALEENTDAIRENTDLIRNPPRYQTGGGGPTTGVTDYSAMLAAARAAILSQNAQTVSRYDAGSGTTAARLSASWRGHSTTVLNLDGREVARATKDYMDEELAF